MMYGFERNNKSAGIHWLKTPITDLQIKINLRAKDTIINPTQDERDSKVSSQQIASAQTQEYTFTWQEKVFNKWEIIQYSDSYKCTSETELSYNTIITQTNKKPSIVSTQINEDIFENFTFKSQSKPKGIIDNLSSCLERLNVDYAGKNMVNSDSTGYLFKSEEQIHSDDVWISMNIVLDCSDYREDQIVMKRQETLVSLHYNPNQHCLIISPDVRSLKWDPYVVSVGVSSVRSYEYSVIVDTGNSGPGKEVVELLTKLHRRWFKRHKAMLHFTMPPLSKRQTLLNLELISAEGFEFDNLYIEYHLKVSEDVECGDQLHGRTHVSKALRADAEEIWHYGHPVELCLVTDAGLDPPSITLILEVISTDWWGGHRTEGYAHISLPLYPGHGTKTLPCLRPEERDKVQADCRRFFIGGCNLLPDLDVLVYPQDTNPNFTYISTGTVNIRWSTISQTHTPGLHATTPARTTFSSSALLKGAEAVLRQYKRAKARLHAATGCGDDGSDG